MDLNHQFTVPTSVDETWARFQDIASIAECFPGATVTSVEGDTFQGTCKVKLGPIALTYAGSGTFVEKDEDAHSFVVEAKGRDKRGNGTAGATVTLTMAAADAGTDVEVATDLSITGKPAQFGRGVMQDVSDKLLGQFVDCLERRLGGSSESQPAAAPGPAAAAETPASAEPTTSAEPATPAEPAAPAEPAVAAEPAATPVAPVAPPPAATPRPATATSARGSDDALDLGKTVLPVLAKAYWKQALAVVVVIVVIIWLIAR
jgi:carbon monoxide dehydrogenase subunit G